MTSDIRELADPTITETEVRNGGVAVIGSLVKHFGERFTPYATARVVGFRNTSPISKPFISVLVEPFGPQTFYAEFLNGEWGWDRTELVPADPWMKGDD